MVKNEKKDLKNDWADTDSFVLLSLQDCLRNDPILIAWMFDNFE